MIGAGKAAAWLCIISSLHMGCYSSALIDPAGNEKDKVYTDTIKMVITKDGTKYEFVETPTIASNAVVGTVNVRLSEGIMKKQVTIPLSDIERAEVSEFSASKTILLGVGIAAIVAFIYAAVLNDSMNDIIEPYH